MSAWTPVRLEDCAEIVSGATPSTSEPSFWGGDICWVTPKDLSGLEGAYISDTARKLTRSGLESCAATTLPPESVLFSSRAPIGHVAINTVPMATNQGFKSFVPRRERLHPKFLYHWLRMRRTYLESLGNGATFKEVSKAIVSRIEVPLPSISEQERIAAILDKVDVLCVKRRAALAQLGELTQAIFLNMFGNPVTNPRQWPLRSIGELGEVITGNTPSRAEPANYGTAIEWIKSDNISAPNYYVAKAVEGLSEIGKAKARVVPPGAILVTCIAGSPDSIGNAALTDREVAFNQQINALVPSIGDAHFLYGQIRVGKKLVQTASTASMKGMVSKSRFEAINLMFPPDSLQEEFACRAMAIEKLKVTQRRSLEDLDALFASLQYRAFRGEL